MTQPNTIGNVLDDINVNQNTLTANTQVNAPTFKDIRSSLTPAQKRAYDKLTPAQRKQLREQGLMWGLISADAAEGGTQSLLQVFMQAARQGLLSGTAPAQQALQRLIKQSAWGRKYTETQEAFMLLKYQYPEEYDKLMNGSTTTIGGKTQKIGGWVEWVTNTALQNGAQISNEEAIQIAETINMNGYNTQQAERLILGYVDFGQADLLGKAGVAQDSLNEYARQFGIKLTPDKISAYVQDYVFGRKQLNDIVNEFKKEAAQKYSNFSDRILAGETIESIANPYRSMAQDLLEMPEISLDDNLLLDALSGKNQDGSIKYASLSDFKRAIKNDPRWQTTDNARSEYVNIGEKILRDFGFLG